MERTIKNTSGRLLAGFLAVIMVFSLFITMLTELDFASIFASASGDDSGKDDTLHTNTAYSNTDYSVITGEIALIGDGFGTKDLSADLKAALGTNAKVKLYTDGQSGVQAALTAAASTDISLVVFACGTRVCIENNGSVATFKSDLDNAVKAFKARGIDVLLVSPGPVTEYGENMYYTEHADVWTPGQVASGDNITNRIKEAVDSITAVAEENNVGFLSVYGKVKLTGEAKYMEGSAEGVFPGEYGYTLMTRWIAEYIAENYVFARKQLGSTTTLSGTETVIDLGTAYDDIDGIVLKFPANTTVPSKLSVQSTKSVEDQWFEAVADATVVDEDDYVKVVSLVFESATARYFRVSGDVAFPAGTTAAIYQTALSNPVMTYPVIGDEVSTKHAFNIEWSAVAGADRYDIVIEKADGTVVKTFTTSEDTQAIPAGVLQDGINYNIKISSLCSGYIDMDDHSGAGASGVFSAADDAVYTGNSEKYEESVSAGKLVTIGDQDILSTNVDVTVNGQVTVDGKTTALLTDLGRSDYVGDAKMIKLHSSTDGATQVEVVLDLAFEADSVTGVFFDASFFALSSSANAKPESVVVSYAGEDGEYSTGRDMAVSSSVRTIRVSEDSEVTGDMTRYGETVGARNIRYVKMVFTFANKDRSDFWLDEIYVVGSADDKGVIARDGVTVLNEGLVGANSFYGTYTAGMWITDPRFVAVASTGAKAVPVELVVNLNADLHNNAIGYADSVVTGVELSFAVDTDAIRPSSIVVSVQKSGETKWTEVGAKVYVNNGTVSADDAEFITEYIPLTSKDASDVLASYVKITLYTDISNTSVPAAYDSTGKWGTWFALSHLDVIGGQYIDSIEADGATAAYHANYLQNTNLLGRDNYGNVNNTDIWNSISWKTAGYKTNDSGYYEILGNVTVGKIYWASEAPAASANTNVIADAEVKANGSNTPALEPKADTNIALGKQYYYSVRPAASTASRYGDTPDAAANAYHAGELTDGKYSEYSYNSGDAWLLYLEKTAGQTIDFVVDLGGLYNITEASIHIFYRADQNLYNAPSDIKYSYSSDGNNWSTASSIISNTDTSKRSVKWTTTNSTLFPVTLYKAGSASSARYVKFSVTTTQRLVLDEIEIFGNEIVTDPTNVAKDKNYIYSEKPNYFSATRANDTPDAAANVWHTGELTDGTKATYTFLESTEMGWIVYNTSDGASRDFVVDLGGYYDISKAGIRLQWGGNNTNSILSAKPSKATVSFSGASSYDAVSWGTAHNIADDYEVSTVYRNASSTAEANYANVNYHYYQPSDYVKSVRFVKFTVANADTTNYRIIIDELEVWGVPAAQQVDTEKPTLSDLVISNVTSTGFDISVNYSDNVGVTSVKFPVWTSVGSSDGQDDMVWHEATLNNGVATYHVNTSDHNGEYGKYIIHAYAYDAAGNETGLGGGEANVPAPVIEGIVNLAPLGTYAYNTFVAGEGVAYNENNDYCVMGRDYEVPNYDANGSTHTIAGGGTGYRGTLNEYGKGKLNDGVLAKHSNGVTPYHYASWHTKSDVVITFDLGYVYDLENIYFRSPARSQAAAVNTYIVKYYFSEDGQNWSSASTGTWKEDGTVQQSSSNTTLHKVYRNSVNAPAGNYRYVKIVFDNPTDDTNTATQLHIDEIFIYGTTGASVGPDPNVYNWALEENGGSYKGLYGSLLSTTQNTEVYTSGSSWDAYHSGRLNNGTIELNTPAGNNNTDFIELQRDSQTKTIVFVYKLKSKVDISSVNVYTATRSGSTNRGHADEINVYVTEAENQVAAYTTAEKLGSTSSGTAYNGSSYTKKFTVNGEQTGKYVIVELIMSTFGYVPVTEIEINGKKSAQLDAPIITSHYNEQEIGVETDLDWNDVTADEDGTIVTYDVDITDKNGNTVSVAKGITSSNLSIDSTPFTAGEGYYTITVTAAANGWYSGTTNLVVYYAPKYIITFVAADGALLKHSGQTSQSVQFGVYQGTTWDSDEVLGAIAGITALPYTDNLGAIKYFSGWSDGENVGIPTTGEVTSNATFVATYTLDDTTGTANNSQMTDGKIFDGTGNKADYYFTFDNDNQAYDYMIIDLGRIYYALTEFDVSFYKMGDVLPFQITFEVSSKVYVPTISQGAAFDDSDWQYVSVVQSDSFVYDEKTGRYSFSDDAKYAPIIDGAFGRYIKVTFHYDTDCEGVYVDEVMVSGSDDHDRTNIAEEKKATVGGIYSENLTNGVETAVENGSEFIVELDDVKTGITSFQMVGGDDVEASFYISAGGDDFVLVEKLVGDGEVYKLSDKVSARRVKVVLNEAKAISEIRIYGDPGLENYYYVSGISTELKLKSGTVKLDNVISIDAVDAKLYGSETEGDSTTASGANGSGTGFAMTDATDAGYANGVSFVNTDKGRMWYSLYSSKKGITNYINAAVVLQWKPTLDSTAVDFTLGNKTYKFEFNGDVKKGFVILQSGSATPYSYTASRAEGSWTVEFTVPYADVTSSNVESNVSYTVTAYENGASVGTTGAKTYNTDGTTEGWDYANAASSWTTLSGYEGDVIALVELDRVYYGLNTFAISILDAKDRLYAVPENVRFQVSTDNENWTDVGYTAKETFGDYRYYEQYQPGEAYVYNFSVNFEGISAKYVRAVMHMADADTSKKVAVQEFWVNALPKSPKSAGGNSAVNSFDYKMLWDDEYLYIALQYEEDEIPFYTASHDYYETFSVNQDTSKWKNSKNDTKGTTTAFAKSSLFYDDSTGFFQLKHDITTPSSTNTNAAGYSNVNLNNFKLYKVSSIEWNKTYTVTGARFKYGTANLATSIETSEAKYVVDTDINKNTLADDSVMNGYIIVSEGYALSQDIDGSSLAAKPITVDGDTIPADQITNDLVWFFESDELITGLSDYGKTLGDYIIYGYRYENSTSNHVDRIYLDDVSSMEYSKYYLTRAYQGLIWENVYTFTRDNKIPNTHINVQGAPEYIPSDSTANINEGEYNVNYRNNHMSGDINWNVVYDTNTSSWSMYVHAQGYRRYSSFYDNVDGRSAFRLYMSVANLNDTARHDYGNYDFVLDTYIIDDATMTLEDGSTYPLTSDSPYLIPENSHDAVSAWDDYKNVEFKSTAIGMTQETNEYRLDVSKLKGKAKASQSENGQNVFTVEIAIPFTQLGFVMDKTGTTVNKFGNYYTKMGIEKPLGKRTLMQFDSKYDYTADNDNGSNMADVDEFYYYVDASEFGYVLQMAPEGKGYQDLSYTDGDGYSTISSVRGEVLNTDNGKEIEYTPNTFEISKIHTTNADPDYAEIVANLKARDAFIYREENGIYYFDTQFDHNRIINQGGTVSTELVIPKGGAYFSFDWKASTETSDTLSVWVETTERWNEEYKDWIQTYNCGIPYKYYTNATNGSQKTWTGVLDYADKSLYTLYSERMVAGDTSWKVNGVELKNDPCVAFISGYKDITRDPENLVLASWKEMKRSMGNEAYPVNIDDVIVFSPIVSGNGNVDYGMYRHAWDWNNVTIWIPNTTGADLDYTITWMFWKNGSQKESYNASDGRGTDDAQITNFRLSTTDELGYWKNSENWDTLRLDATVADPTETMLGIDRLAKEIVAEGESVPAINATGNNPGGLSENNTDRLYTNTFGESDFLTLSYAAIAATEESGNTTTTTTYYQTKNKISLSASNVPTADIEKYINNAIVFTQEYEGHLSDAGALLDWTILELQYNTSYNTWVLSRMFEEGVDKSKFNIHADNNTIIIALNYTYNATDDKAYGKSRDAVLFGYTNREVLGLLTPAIRYKAGDGKIDEVIAANDASLTVTQFITSNVFIRENFNVARGKMYSLRNLPTYWDNTYMYTENWFRENNTEDALAAFLSVYSETPLYYVNEKGEIGVIGENGTFNPTIANTDGDYRQAFQYKYSSNKTLRFDTNQYGNVLYVPAGVGQLTDGEKMSVYSHSYLVEALEDYAIGFFVGDGMGTPDADVIEDIDVTDTVFSYIQQIDTKHDEYEVKEDIRVREENVILDLGSVEYGLSAFKLRFLGGGEDGVVFPTSVEFAISTDGLSYSYIGSVALDDTGFNSATFGDAYASIIYTGATDTIYGNTVADYTFDLQTEGVTARYIKATIMNHSSQNEKTFISEFQVIQNAIYPDTKPNTNASTWVDVSEDAILMYQDTIEMWDNVLNRPYGFALAPTMAGYLFAEDEGYADDGRANNATNTFLNGQLTDGKGGTDLYKRVYNSEFGHVSGTEFVVDAYMAPQLSVKSIKLAKGNKTDAIADGTQATLYIDGVANGTVIFNNSEVVFDTPIKANNISVKFDAEVNVSEFYVFGTDGTNYARNKDFYIGGVSENKLGDGSEWTSFAGTEFAVTLNGIRKIEVANAGSQKATIYASTDNGASYFVIAQDVDLTDDAYSIDYVNGYYANGIDKFKVVLANTTSVSEISVTDIYGAELVVENEENLLSNRMSYGLNTVYGLKDLSVGWMKAYAAEVSLTFNMEDLNDVGYVSVYALESKDSVDKINQPYNVTAYVSDDNITWRKVATVNAKDNDSSEVSLKGMDVVVETDDYIVYRYNLTFARDGELGLQLNDYQYVKVVAETDGGEDGWICLTEVEVYEGHPCYPVIDLTDSKFKKTAIGLTEEDVKNQTSEVRPTFFRGFYDSNLYEDEIPDGYVLNVVYNNVEAEQYTRNYVFGNVEQRALDGRDIPYFYGGDQLLLRVTSNQLFATEYNYQGDWVSTYKLLADSRIYYTNVTDTGNTTTRLFTTTAVPTPLTVCNVLARDEFTGALPEDYVGEDAYYYLPIFLKNSLEYLKAEGYNVDKANQGANYINMPENRVELTGEVLWDTNYESDYDEYANDENGISLNLAPLGAKTNLGTVKYNGIDRAEGTTLRFGSIWYIDDAAYYNTHTHRQQYGTLIFTLNNLNRYLTDTFPTRAPYSTVYEDYGLQMTKLNTAVEVTGVEEIKNVIEVIKLTGVTEVKKLSGVAEATEDTAKFMLTVDGELVYYTCDDDIQVNDTIGRVWKTANGYFYSENKSISKYKFTTGSGENTKYWYCTENVDRVNWVDENGYWYSPSEDLVDATDVYSVVLNNGNTVYYHYQTEDETTELPAIKIMSRDSSGVAHYWTCNEDYPSWTYVTVEGNDIRYWYSSNYEGIAGGVVCDENGTYYATSNSVVYNGLITTIDGDGNTRYWSASSEEAFVMLSDLQDIIKYEYDSAANKFTFDEEQVMAGLDRYLEYANKYGTGQQGHNNNYLTFGGIVQHSRANRYYYYSNITTELVPDDYENGNIFAGVDSDSADGQNMTELLGVYNYDQRYLEFDAIIAGIPASQKSAKIVAVPYAIYANNYEFLEFGEHLGKDDAYVEETWGEIFNKYYGGENAMNDIRYYVYGGAVARSITDVLAAQDDLPKQYD